MLKKYIAEISHGNKIHLLLLDYKLRGGVMGDSVARKIKEYSETNVILISAYNIDNELVNELKNGSYITKYVPKPIDSECLINLIDEIIKN